MGYTGIHLEAGNVNKNFEASLKSLSHFAFLSVIIVKIMINLLWISYDEQEANVLHKVLGN